MPLDSVVALMHANLLEIFGQRDPVMRRDAMGRNYAQDITFIDPAGTVRGYDAVDEQVRKVLDGAPEVFAFTADGPLYTLGDGSAALPWTFGPVDGPPVARGIDIATIVDGRIQTLQTLLAT